MYEDPEDLNVNQGENDTFSFYFDSNEKET